MSLHHVGKGIPSRNDDVIDYNNNNNNNNCVDNIFYNRIWLVRNSFKFVTYVATYNNCNFKAARSDMSDYQEYVICQVKSNSYTANENQVANVTSQCKAYCGDTLQQGYVKT